MTRMPDFMIVGAMKCATSTLHEQLARQPGMFMSTPKEPCFFSDDDVYERGIAWYASLFADAPAGALCGESSTHYTKLPTYPDAIARMRHHLPSHAKFVYIMRHPIDRVVSQYIHEWTQRELSCDIDQAVDVMPELIEYSRYAWQIQRYLDTFGKERVLPMFFERLATHPQTELERVCEFIGYRGHPVWDATLGEQNVSTERLRKSVWRDALVNTPGLKHIRRAFVPKAVRDRVKSFWTMKHKPTLSRAMTNRLRDIFDEDLAKLGRWLDLDLNCDNFKSVVRDTALTWTNPVHQQPRRTAAA